MRFVNGLGGLSRLLEQWMVMMPVAVNDCAELSAKAVEKTVKSIYGTDKLQDLADSTQDERESLGYAPNEPLWRTGELLADSVRIERPSLETAIIGSPEPIHAYHEYGYWNVRAGKPTPARPVFKIASVEALPFIESFTKQAIAAVFFGKGVARLLSNTATADFESTAVSELDSSASMQKLA